MQQIHKWSKEKTEQKESSVLRRINNGYVQNGYHKACKEVWD